MMKINLCHLQGVPIFQQLKMEEALLRIGSGNWCLVNSGAPPAIVMGMSGIMHELIDPTHYQINPMPIIRRFSGGGTVFIEENTLFVTFLFERSELDLGQCPAALMRWTEAFYKPLFANSEFQARESDYVIGEKKVGGNAQYISKHKWLHHTSFLWDFCQTKMQVLKMPPKRPSYRQERAHEDFLTKLHHFFDSKESFFEALIRELESQFSLTYRSEQEILPLLEKPHRRSVDEQSPEGLL